jgi:ribosome-binding ATPase YchF (GTP1/OBG family)
MLENNIPIRNGMQWSTAAIELIKDKLGPTLTTTKPMIYVCNVSQDDLKRLFSPDYKPIDPATLPPYSPIKIEEKEEVEDDKKDKKDKKDDKKDKKEDKKDKKDKKEDKKDKKEDKKDKKEDKKDDKKDEKKDKKKLKKNTSRPVEEWMAEIRRWVDAHGGGLVFPISVDHEQELLQCQDNPEKLKGMIESQQPNLIRQGYQELNMITYFTCGETEVRAWTVYGGALAPEAAGVIHGDFEKFFVKGEIVHWDDFYELQKTPGMAKVKEAGKYHIMGKQYVVQDGDICTWMIGK